MHAMMLNHVGRPLEWTELADRHPGAGEIRVKVLACGVCRTDLHVVDGELPAVATPLIPGHEIVGRIDAIGSGVTGLTVGERVGIPWLGHTCGVCPYCRMNRENLCDRPLFTGYTRDGGYATATVADARFAFPLGEAGTDVALAPLLCAGLIGWRSLVIAGAATRIGLYGFGAAAHIIAQVARWQGRSVFAFVRPGDEKSKQFALELGAVWAGGSDEMPPEPLEYQGHAAIAEFFQTRMARWGTRVPQLVPARANNQPAFGYYPADPQAPVAHVHSLIVLTLAGDRICAITRFGGNCSFPGFGLPQTLPH